MFVASNSYDSLKKHFEDKLLHLYSDREIRTILLEVIRLRFNDKSIDNISVKNYRFSESDLLYFREIRQRLIAGEPFQYVIGSTEFYGLEIKTDKRALIPRPETEELVDWILSESDHENALVDLCSGSGCIALALKSQWNGEVTAVELSSEAIKLIQENVELNNRKIHVIQADVLSDEFWETIPDNSIGVFVSNPPYVLESDKESMASNVIDYEPHMALFVENEDPLLFYRIIGSQALSKLINGGELFFEIHERFGREILILLEHIGFVNIELRKDLQGRDRMIRAKK